MFEPLIVPGALDENPAHGKRGGGEEVPATVPSPILTIAGDAKIRFVNQCSRLQRLVSLALAAETGSRQFPQFVIDFRQQFVRRAGPAVRCGVPRHQEREL